MREHLNFMAISIKMYSLYVIQGVFGWVDLMARVLSAGQRAIQPHVVFSSQIYKVSVSDFGHRCRLFWTGIGPWFDCAIACLLVVELKLKRNGHRPAVIDHSLILLNHPLNNRTK